MSDYLIASEPIEIAAPASVVWQVIVDLPGYAAWNPLNRRVESTLKLGDPVKLWITDPELAKAGAVFVHRLVALEPERHIAWEYRDDGPTPVRTRRDQHVTALTDGACTYHTTDRFFGPGAARLMELYGAGVKASFDELSRALKRHAEQMHAC